MLDLNRELCVCNSMTLGDIVTIIKANEITTIEDAIKKCDVGDKCESCIEEGYENDGFSIAMVLSLVKQNRL